MSIRSAQMIKKSNDWILSNKQKPFLSPVFKKRRCHGNNSHLSQNARLNPSVVKLDSCKKRAPKHKQFQSNGELGTGTS